MKLSIRLQNHGCANHPYWWIVVAPNRKNIRGRFIEHVGYWAPRQGAIVDRQITLNIPRIKYWIGNGAVPTFKVQKFLSLWDIMPKPFQVPRQKALKDESQMTDKQKIKADRKRKSLQRLKLPYINYHKSMAKYKSYQTYHYVRHYTKLREKIQAAERENQILRELLLHNEYIKINRINELSGNAPIDDKEELVRLEKELKKAKAELALLDKNLANSSPLQKINAIKQINSLVDKIREVEKQREPFRKRDKPTLEGEGVSKEQLDREIEYQLITKKLERVNKEMQHMSKLYEVVTLEDFANFLMVNAGALTKSQALEVAEEIFTERGKVGMPPLTRYELYYQDEWTMDPEEILQKDKNVIFDKEQKGFKQILQRVKQKAKVLSQKRKKRRQQAKGVQEAEKAETEGQQGEEGANQSKQAEEEEQYGEGHPLREKHDDYFRHMSKELGFDVKAENKLIEHVDQQNLIKFLMTRPDVLVPTNRPVHPFPDLTTYVPEEYYEPITEMNLQVVQLNSLEPNDELLKYHKKRTYSSNKSSKGLKSSKKEGKRVQQTV